MSAIAELAFTTEQIEAFLQRIRLPRDFRPRHEAGRDIEDLTKLHKAYIVTVPFDDAEIHYSKHHNVTLDPVGLYDKIVTRRQGGYCMQGNTLFEHLLRALGFDVYPTGCRVRPRTRGIPSGPYLGWCHQVNIVQTVDGRQFSVDVAFGGDGPLVPMPMIENEVVPNIGTRRSRLTKKSLGRNPKFVSWVYQIQFNPSDNWLDVYSFTETEFLPQDFGVMSYWTSTHPASWMTHKFVGVKMITEGNEIVGKYTIDHGTIKKNIHGESELIMECQSEEERVAALAKYFDLVLSPEDQEAIKGFAGEIKPQPNA